MTSTCIVHGCLNTKNAKERRFFHIPADEKRCKEWLRIIDREDLFGVSNLKAYCICDAHFNETDFNGRNVNLKARSSLLLPGVSYEIDPLDLNKCTEQDDIESMTPFLNVEYLKQSTDTKICKNRSMQTIKVCILTPRQKRKLDLESEEAKKCKLEHHQRALNSNSSTLSDMEDMTPQLKKIVELQKNLKRNNNVNSRGNKYGKELKYFGLILHFTNPEAYKFLSNTLMLPSTRTLRKVEIDFSTKLTSSILQCLKLKYQKMDDIDKICTISADLMVLRKNLYFNKKKEQLVGVHEIHGEQTMQPASKAFVLMAKGLFSGWKQPLSYCFLAQSRNYTELISWIDNVISKLQEIGFKVVAFISGQASVFLNIANEKKVSYENPFFFVNDKKIYYIFDVPHLVKSVRNNLMKFDFYFHDNDGTQLVASWKDITRTYEIESSRHYKIAPKISEQHVKPNMFEKSELIYALQIFSKTFATAMYCYMEMNQLPYNSYGTVKFIEIMNNVFDVLNSSGNTSENIFKHAFSNKAHQVETIKNFLNIINDLKVYCMSTNKDVTTSIKCFKSFKITLNSILSLSNDLVNEDSGRNIQTRRLNHDDMGKLFDDIKKHMNNKDVTALQFSVGFKKQFIANIFGNLRNSSGLDNLDELLTNAENLGVALNADNEKEVLYSFKSTEHQIEFPTDNKLNFICQYLLKKSFLIHSCKNNEIFLNTIRTNHESDSFDVIPDSFQNFVKELDVKINCLLQNKIGHRIIKELIHGTNNISYLGSPCECFPFDYVKSLFIRIKIFNITKFNSKFLTNKKNKLNDLDLLAI